MCKCLSLLSTLLFAATAFAQPGPHVLSVRQYQAQIKTQPQRQLVEIVKAVPDIKLDIRYATTNNFMHHKMYAQARAFARAPVVAALKQVQANLRQQGLGLKIFDAYRPYAVTVAFYKLAKDTNFVADPKYGSKHNRGCAIDLTVIDLKTGKELRMPTGFDSFSRRAASNYMALNPEELKNRNILKTAMENYGFTELRTEWWHFDYTGWRNYELLDVPFESL